MSLPSNSLSAKKIAKILLGLPLTLASFGFIFYLLYQHKNEVFYSLQHADRFALVLGLGCVILFFFLKAVIWKLLLTHSGYPLPTVDTFFYYQQAEIKRYIPSSILSFISRVGHFEDLKVPKKVTLRLILIETIILVLSSFIISIPSIIFFYRYIQSYLTTLYIGLSIILLLFVGGIIALRYKKIKLPKIDILSYIDIFAVSLFSWMLFGLGNYLIAISFSYITPTIIIQLCSFFVLAWLLGYLSFIIPMGLGVREVIITLGLSIFISPALSSIISIVQRIIFVLAELALLAFFTLSKKNNYISQAVIFIQKHIHIFIVVVSSLMYIVYFSYVSFEKHNNFFTGRFDLGNMDQTVWNTIHGRIFMLTNPDNVNTISRLGIHADFILILLSPFYLIWEDPRTLLFIQSFMLGIGAIFVYLLSRQITKHQVLSVIFSLSYLLNPWIQKQNLFDFHAITLATTFLLATFYFLNKKNYLLFIAFFILSALTKENVYFYGIFFGVYIFSHDKKKLGLALSIISAVILYFLIAKFIPSARGGSHFALAYYQDFGDSPLSIMRNILLKPQTTFSYLMNFSNLYYLRDLFLSVGYLCLLAPSYLLFSSADIGINLLSNNMNLKSINFHYGATIIPFVYISSMYAAYTLMKKYDIAEKILVYYILIFSLFSTWLLGVLPGSRFPTTEIFTQRLSYRSKVKTFINAIPTSYSVSATNNLGAHVSERQVVYTIPNGVDNADVIVLLLNDVLAQPSLSDQIKLAETLKKDSRYIQIYKIGDFIAFQKKSLPPIKF